VRHVFVLFRKITRYNFFAYTIISYGYLCPKGIKNPAFKQILLLFGGLKVCSISKQLQAMFVSGLDPPMSSVLDHGLIWLMVLCLE